MVSSGELLRPFRGVFVSASSPSTWEQRQAAACAWGGEGAASSGRAAAYLHNLEGIEAGVHELTLPSARKAPKGLVVHRSRAGLGRIVTKKVIPCTDIWRTLFDLAMVVEDQTLEIALDDALRKGLVKADRLHERLVGFGTAGRNGHRGLKALVEERLGSPPSGSGLNSRLRRAFRDSTLPMPKVEFDVVVEGRFIARPDFAYPEALLAIEGQSRKYHTGAHWELHNARLNQLTVHGWLVLNATWRVFEDDCVGFLDEVRRVREERLALFRKIGYPGAAVPGAP